MIALLRWRRPAAPAARAQVEASVPVVARFELTGPLEDPELGYGESRTLVRGALLRAERRTLEVPFLPPRFLVLGRRLGGGRARSGRRRERRRAGRRRARALPGLGGLRPRRALATPAARAREPSGPDPDGARGEAAPGGGATLLAGGIVVLLLRSRPRAALAAGLVCAGLVASPLAVLRPRRRRRRGPGGGGERIGGDPLRSWGRPARPQRVRGFGGPGALGAAATDRPRRRRASSWTSTARSAGGCGRPGAAS